MSLMNSRAVLMAGARLIPAGILTKEAPDLETMLDQHAENVRQALEGFEGKNAEFQATLIEIEQKLARRGSGGSFFDEENTGSWGAQFIASADQIKAFHNDTSRPGRFRVDMKTTLTSASNSAGGVAVPGRDDVSLMPQRRLTIRNLLPVIKVTTGSVEYPQMTTRTNNADTVAEGAQKPESAYAFELKQTPMRVIAHWVPASRQILDDAPQLQGTIDTELRYGLALKEEAQLLLGDGTGQNLFGLIPQATAYAAPAGVIIATENMIDRIGLAILQQALTDMPADGIVLHPSDWTMIRLLKDADGKYIMGDPAAQIDPRLFGLPVVVTPAIPQGNFLVGNFQMAATLYDRWEARVEVSTEHADFFTRNLVAILAEERLGLAVKKRLALTYGAFED